MDTITAALKAIAEFFGFINRRTDLKNKPDVVAAEKAQQQVDIRNEIEDSVEKQDVEATRRDIAE